MNQQNPNQNYNPNQGYNQNQGYQQPYQQTPDQSQPYGSQQPYQQTINVNMPQQPHNPKSKIAAGLLGIFLGAFGVHNFYLGYTGKAVAQLLISVLSCGLLAAISSVWGLIEGILVLTGSINTDAQGYPLSE